MTVNPNPVSSPASVLITRRETRDDYPYRRIWRTALTECALLVAVCLAVYFADRIIGFRPRGALRQGINIALAVFPLLLWLIISFRVENLMREPRRGLLIVLGLSMLGANAIGVPLLDRALDLDSWLTNTTGTTRILGYTLTQGLVQQFIQYASVRYSVWETNIEKRTDGIAYMMAAAVGYAVVLNLNYVFDNDASSSAVALRVIELTLAQYAISPIIGYALWGLKFVPTVTGMPISLISAALLTALTVNFRGSFILGGISATSSGSNPLQGIGFVAFLLIATFISYNFIVNNADERARQQRVTGATTIVER